MMLLTLKSNTNSIRTIYLMVFFINVIDFCIGLILCFGENVLNSFPECLIWPNNVKQFFLPYSSLGL